MNCKPGDLAVVIKARYSPELVGAIVRVLRLYPKGRLFVAYDGYQTAGNTTSWVVEHERVGQWLHCDSRLRPIRDQDGEDETLEWAGKPQEQPCNAL